MKTSDQRQCGGCEYCRTFGELAASKDWLCYALPPFPVLEKLHSHNWGDKEVFLPEIRWERAAVSLEDPACSLFQKRPTKEH